MKDGLKDKRAKKKNTKREEKERDNMQTDYENEFEMRNENISSHSVAESYISLKEPSLTEFSGYNNNIILTGKKGHSNFCSKTTGSTGTFYFEVEIVSSDYNFTEYMYAKRTDEFSKKYYDPIIQNIKSYMPNIRIGFINGDCDKEIPVGALDKSYGYRASDGVVINDGEYKEGNDTFGKGDCIGAMIHLKPPKPMFLRGGNIEQRNSECFIKFFKNGVEQTNGFVDVFEGDYYAAISLYNYSQAVLNLGPKFKYLNLEENKQIKCFID